MVVGIGCSMSSFFSHAIIVMVFSFSFFFFSILWLPKFGDFFFHFCSKFFGNLH
jgi:hypothetical protein